MKKIMLMFIEEVSRKVIDAIKKEMEHSIFEIAKVNLKPGDILFLKVKHKLSHEAMERLRDTAKENIPGIKIAILEDGLDLGVVSKADE